MSRAGRQCLNCCRPVFFLYGHRVQIPGGEVGGRYPGIGVPCGRISSALTFGHSRVLEPQCRVRLGPELCQTGDLTGFSAAVGAGMSAHTAVTRGGSGGLAVKYVDVPTYPGGVLGGGRGAGHGGVS